MKDTGLIRGCDCLGRFGIPKEIRESREIKTQDAIDIYTNGDSIILEKIPKDKEKNSKGIIRHTDELGRIVLPKDLRDQYEIHLDKDKFHIYLNGNKIILQKEYIVCIFCGRKEKIQMILGKPICKSCKEKIQNW